MECISKSPHRWTTDPTPAAFNHINQVFRPPDPVCKVFLTKIMISSQVLKPNTKVGLIDLLVLKVFNHSESVNKKKT